MQHRCPDGVIHEWMPRGKESSVCPRCKGSLDKPQKVKPASPPSPDFIPERGTIPVVRRKKTRTIYDRIRRNYYFNFIPKREVKQEIRRRELVTPYDSIRKNYYFNFIPMRGLLRKYRGGKSMLPKLGTPKVRNPKWKDIVKVRSHIDQEKTKLHEKNNQLITTFDNVIKRNVSCKKILAEHKSILSDDPERLTTDFLVDITGCNCVRRR